MSIQESLKIVPQGDVAFIEWDLIGEKVNKLSTPIMTRFRELLDELKSSSYKAIVFISKKEKIFIAGADIEEIKKYTTKEEYLAALEPAHEIFNMVEDFPIPIICAIHGQCLGGGCELALACDYRICTDADETRIGLPEVKLGIFPGFGGSLRLPRVVGLQASLDIILAGKAVPGKKAKRIGLVDECVPQASFQDAILKLASDIASGKKGKRQKVFKPRSVMDRFLESFVGRPVVFNQARKTVLKQTKGHYPAPIKALDVIKKTYGYKNRSKAIQAEMDGFCEVAITPISKYLIELFFMMEAIKKQSGVANKDIRGLNVKRIGILGAGTMGGGIAHVAADKGIEARMKDLNNDAIGIGLKAASEIWKRKMKRRRMDKFQYDEKMSFISGGLDYQGFEKADVVVEAIVEDMDIKKKVIAETAKNCKPECVIATNTSSLSVTEMAEGHPKPANFAGMHFFNPVHRMPLVEVIRGEKTSDEATATIFNLAKKMGKTPVVVKDGPGFLVNRLLLPFMGEALFLLEEGCSIPKVDRIFTHKFGMPMGPFRLMDEVGLDVCVKVLKIFQNAFGERMEVCSLSEKLKDTDRLGKKNSKGFYLYDEKGKETEVDESVYKELGLPNPTDPLTEKEIIERCVFQMINEAALALVEDRIVETPQDVDLAMIMGTGFPPFRGGLLKYADSLGSEYIVEELEMYSTKVSQRYKPTAPLSQMAKNNKKFYA